MKSVTSFHRGISFTISVSGPSAGVLAFKHLPTQLPLAVLLSLLIGYIARLATASRMSFSGRLIWPLPNGSLSYFVSRCLMPARNSVPALRSCYAGTTLAGLDLTGCFYSYRRGA